MLATMATRLMRHLLRAARQSRCLSEASVLIWQVAVRTCWLAHSWWPNDLMLAALDGPYTVLDGPSFFLLLCFLLRSLMPASLTSLVSRVGLCAGGACGFWLYSDYYCVSHLYL